MLLHGLAGLQVKPGVAFTKQLLDSIQVPALAPLLPAAPDFIPFLFGRLPRARQRCQRPWAVVSAPVMLPIGLVGSQHSRTATHVAI